MLLSLLVAALIHGHHAGWTHPHNPHYRPPCSVAFHVGCAVIDPPPRPGLPVIPPSLPWLGGR